VSLTLLEARAQSIFLDALERAPDGWDALLDSACGGDAELRTRVVRLLEAHQRLGQIDMARTRVPTPLLFPTPVEGPEAVIGPYRLLEQIGEGGFGVVYLAEQSQPVRRQVALKVIKPGMDTRHFVARFEAERQALALMDHPNIARVFDGGATTTGRPYLVMELVRGVPITTFCDRKRLPLRERIELFVAVCQAVQHAHQKGIIHRDLKPSNVLVTLDDDRPVVKVIDFGIAKAVGQPLTDRTLFTGFAQMIGTPPYMSPEQAQMGGLDIDTRTDVYALGVLLYELLTGTTPFDRERLRTLTFDEVRRVIREEEPPAPSCRHPGLSRDVETICLKCLSKDPAGRYGSARELAEDLGRWLAGEPVLARPVGTAGRVWRWCRRKPGLAALTAAVATLAVTVLIGAPIMALRLQRQRDESNVNLKKALEAQALADQKIIEISLEQARALRLTHHVGQRVRSLAALEQAAHLLPRAGGRGPTPLFLRSEVILSLALVDLVDEKRPLPPTPAYGTLVAVDAALARYAYPDGQHVVVSALDDGRELLRIDSPAASLTCKSVAFSPDGKLLSTLYTPSRRPGQGICVVWNLAERRSLRQLDVGGPSTAFSPDGQCLAVVEPRGKSVAIIEIATGAVRRRFAVATTGPQCFAFDDSGRQFVLNATDQSVKVFDLETGSTTVAFGCEGPLHTLAWRSDGQLLAATGWEERVRVWELPAGRLVSVLAGHTNAVTGAVFRNRDGLLFTWSLDGTTRLWDPLSGSELLSAPGAICGLSADEERLAFQDNRRIGVWRIEGGRECRALHHGNVGNVSPRTDTVLFHSVGYSSDGRILAASGRDGVRLWDGSTVRELAHLPLGPTQTLQFLPDGTGLFTLGRSGLERWPIAVDQGGASATMQIGPPQILDRAADPVFNYAALSGDGKTLAIAVNSGRVTVRDLAQDGAPVSIEHRADDRLRSLAVSHDGRWTACGHWQSSPAALVWDNTTGGVARRFESGPAGATSAFVAFSPDGQWLVTCEQGVYRSWKVATWQPGPKIERDQIEAYPGPIAWTRDSRMMAVTRSATGVLLLDSVTGERLATIQANSPRSVRSLEFSPDGRLLAVATIDQQVIIWDLLLVRRELARLGLEWAGGGSGSGESAGASVPDGISPPAVEVRVDP
jgi:serine/threonine protein kinase/WD40 repeat protein